MAKEKSLLQEAIAEAREVREAAVQNAYESLKENLTPSIKAMLEQKLEEEEKINLDETDEESIEEMNNSGFKEVKAPKAKIEEAEDEEKDDAEEKAEKDEAPADEEPDGDEVADAAADHAEPDGDEPEENEAEPAADDTKIEDLTLGNLKNLIADMVAQINATPAPEGNLGADMEAGDVEGAGEEDAPIEDPEAAAEDVPAENPEDDAEKDDEIDLAELLKELEDEEKSRKVVTHSQDSEDFEKKICEVQNKLQEARKERDMYKATVETLKGTLAEVNLVNSKLQCTTKLFNENALSDSQKAMVIKRMDEAKSPREAKSTYITLKESFKAGSGNVLKEHKAMASRAAGNSTKAAAIVEVDPTVKRFQQLAGII